MNNTATQIQEIEKDATAITMLTNVFQYQRTIFSLTNLLDQRAQAVKAKQACVDDKWKKDYENYIEKCNSDIMKLLAI